MFHSVEIKVTTDDAEVCKSLARDIAREHNIQGAIISQPKKNDAGGYRTYITGVVER